MRLNVLKYKELLKNSNLNDDAVIRVTGLSPKSYQYVLDNGFIELCTLERIADAIKCNVQEIAGEDSTSSNENVIEWTRDAKTAVVTLTQGRYISRIRQLAADRPNECKIICNNVDGSICAKIPTKWVKINPTLNLTEEQRKKIGERLNTTR